MLALSIIIMCSIIMCSIMAAVAIFGTLYDPGHPWMDRKRRIGLVILCIAAFIELAAIIVGHA